MSWRQGQTLQQWAGSAEIFALAFTDIVGSTDLGNRAGDRQYVEIVRRHINQGRMFYRNYNGYEIKIIGDAFMVVFHSAQRALNFALDFCRFTGDSQVRIRVGIHVGHVHIDVNENDLIGLMVNYTKRVEEVAKNGGIALSNEAMTHINNEKDPRHAGIIFQPTQTFFRGFNKNETVWYSYV
jgi:adenylate cyclase